ncbi:MAG TPA: hypothetical protein RMG95_13245 [Polyangiaceae bacterium LLY-WYZ-15_(1-7)]|nr:hypothetical protein [Polyangiaceae bacterium LLY-WYZ-15_(1-7)]
MTSERVVGGGALADDGRAGASAPADEVGRDGGRVPPGEDEGARAAPGDEGADGERMSGEDG